MSGETSVQSNCPNCKEPVTVPEEGSGQETRCPACGSLVSVPAEPGSSPGQQDTENPVHNEGSAPSSASSALDPGEPPPPETGPPPLFSGLEGIEPEAPTAPQGPGAGRRWPRWARTAAVGIPALALVIALGAYVAVRLDRGAYARKVEARFAEAEKAYRQARLVEAERALADGLKMIGARPEAVSTKRAEALKGRAAHLGSLIGRWRPARELMKHVDLDPAATRHKLEEHLRRARALGPDGEPLVSLIARMVSLASEKDLARRRAGLEGHFSRIEKQLAAGKFEQLRAGLELARGRISKAPRNAAAELTRHFDGRLRAIEAALQSYHQARKLFDGAPAFGPERQAAAAKLRARLAGLDPLAPASQALAARVRGWIQALGRDARPLPPPLKLSREALAGVARDFAAAAGLKVDEKSLEVGKALFRLSAKDRKYRIAACSLSGQAVFMVEVDGVRLAYPIPRRSILIRACMRRALAQAPILAGTLKESGRKEAYSAEPWMALLQGPGPTAILALPEGKLLCTAGRVWKVKINSRAQERRQAALAFIEAAGQLERAVLSDERAGKELREVLAVLVRASYRSSRSRGDFLPGPFCRQAVARGYIKKNTSQLADRLEDERAAYRAAYRGVIRFQPELVGSTPAGGHEIEWGINTDGRSLWRIYDAGARTTSFALRHNDSSLRTQFFVHTVFAGKHAAWPATELPKAVRMVHQSVGEVASWDPETDKFTCDRERWRRAADLEDLRPPPAHFGRPEWRFPPHVLLVDSQGNALGLVTPQGRLDMPEFGRRTGAARRKAQDKFLTRVAKVLGSPGELHLFFRYFAKYCYDSPLTSHPFLIGDKRHTGDVHQDAYQTLDRKIAGRFIADCDDLAEFYQAVTRRQKRLSFVLGMPSHAVCGFVEKKGGEHVFTCVDTGPPRQFRGKRLDAVIEAGSVTFDEERTEAFDPNSVCYLLRFAGEQTRTPYYLGTRMFVDPVYAETMIRVQRDWHFAYIVSGRDTMVEMIKRDPSPPNCFELAAFYRELGDWPRAIKWARKGIAALPAEDQSGRLTESLRLASYHQSSGDRKEALRVLAETGRKLDQAAGAGGGKEGDRFLGLRLAVATHMTGLERPWAAWQVAGSAARKLVAAGKLGGDNVTRLASLLLKMRELERGGRKLADGEKAAAGELDGILAKHFAARHFKERDTFRALMDKYADLALFYAARNGREYALEKLLAEGPYPSGQRVHFRRQGKPAEIEAEDWKWIRLSIYAYNFFSGRALDPEEPVEKRRPQEAVRILKAMEKAIPHTRKHGALGGMEFAVLSMRVKRDAITKDWAGLDETFKLMKKRNWGRLYRLVAMSLGAAAAYMTDEEFEAQFRKFCEARPPLPHYLRVAYAALEAKRDAAALTAARLTAERFPDKSEVQREYRLLEKELTARGLIKKEEEPKEKKPPAPKKPAA